MFEPGAHALRDPKALGDGVSDGLEPLQSLDIGTIGDADELLAAMSRTAFNGRRLGEAAEVLAEMVTDPECSVILTLSGAMTVAKMGLIITAMIERGWVQAVVSTGALMTHGLVELAGMPHFKARDNLRDEELFQKGYNRVYDTYELESSLNTVGFMLKKAFATFEGRPFGSRELLERVGEMLTPLGRRGVLVAARNAGVPIYIPALTDSEMGLNLAAYFLERRLQEVDLDQALAELGTPYDPYRDLAHLTRFVLKSPRIGIFTIGGGVPRNWAQQVSPFVDYVNRAANLDAKMNRIHYGVRICPEPVHWGGLSGCTYSEGVSWGKFVPTSEGGRFAEVLADATLAWPLLVQGVAQRLEKSGREAASPALDLEGCRPAAATSP
ncbi:MAG: deoxyhypusine synthase family protein [Alphaproteobacteria bacterium]|nr:deoxyhypusine synthase family protein [Alphaproteobacteria bacterium]